MKLVRRGGAQVGLWILGFGRWVLRLVADRGTHVDVMVEVQHAANADSGVVYVDEDAFTEAVMARITAIQGDRRGN